MHCLSPTEVEAMFIDPRFSVSLDHAGYRSALCLDPSHATKQVRIAAEQPSRIRDISSFVRRLNRWLPTNQPRLLWVDHWETGLFGGFENAVAAATWRGLGEVRSLEQTPGLYFDKQNWDEEDQLAVSPAQAEALGVLVGIVAMLMITMSDGWLISAGCTDRVGFWEGHFFFHSHDQEQVRLANEIVDAFGCVRWKS
jgi:hypothetical protein